MSPQKTLEQIVSEAKVEDGMRNRILQVLGRPYGGMNEIFSLVEVNKQISNNNYDCVVLDTPPGGHFLDFLESCKKINRFFDSNYSEIFKFLGKKLGQGVPTKGNIFKLFISTGIKKLLEQLEKVTGGEFINEFIDAIDIIFALKKPFMEALNLESTFRDSSQSNWFLVTSVDQHKLEEAVELKEKADQFMHMDSFIILNKCLSGYADTWQDIGPDSPLGKLKNSLLQKENSLKKFANEKFSKIIEFGEVLDSSPQEQVTKLSLNWKVIVNNGE